MTDSDRSSQNSFPKPLVNDDNAFLYEGFSKNELRIQRCEACETLRFPPGPMCPHCKSTAWDTIKASGKGRVYSYAIHHHPPIPPHSLPLILALVDLDEGVRFMAGMPDTQPDEIRIGMEVELRFRELDTDFTLPFFVNTNGQ